MRVFIAGATGAIGRPLTAALRDAGHDVIALVRKPTARVPGAQLAVADVLDRDALLRAVDGMSADAVIHELTALAKPPTRYRGMEMTNTLRITGTKHLLEAAQALGARRFVTQSMVPGSTPQAAGLDYPVGSAPFRQAHARHVDAGVERPSQGRT